MEMKTGKRRKAMLIGGLILGLYFLSFSVLVLLGYYDAGFDGWEFNYFGKTSWDWPRVEHSLYLLYWPAYTLSQWVGIPLTHLSSPLRPIED
jgi:hypothetical protein